MNDQLNERQVHHLSAAEFLDFSVRLLKAGKEGRSITPIQQSGSKLPFFAIPGFLLYRQLSFYMGEDQPFYGFEPFPYNSVQDAARQYINEMKVIQPHGPYLLGAYCNHYAIIFEMADMLLKRGESVPLIVLFECYAPSAIVSRSSYQYLSGRLKRYRDQLKNKGFMYKLRFFLREFNKGLGLVYLKLKPSRQVSSAIKPYPGKVILFKASDSILASTDDPLRGWANHVTGSIEAFTIPGEHLGILKHPCVKELAKTLSKSLNEVAMVYSSP